MAILIAESGGHTMSTSIEEKIAQKMQRFQAFGEGLREPKSIIAKIGMQSTLI